ncbi:MAG: PA14 domain-containing protein [Verrucomicrobiota bacterium]
MPELTYGQPLRRDFSQPYETDIYRLPGRVGQRIFYDGLDNDFDAISIYLTAFSGRGYFSNNSDHDAGPVTLVEPGVNFLFLENQQDLADYNFRIDDLSQPPTRELNLDSLVGAPLLPVPGTALQVTGSYVNTSLRNRPDVDDWRSTQTISGTRTESVLAFADPNWGRLFSVGLSAGPNGADERWENFSVQWDGAVTITTPGTRLFLRSQDGSRMWIDVNGDGAFAEAGSEFLNNGWGQGQGTTLSQGSVPLDPGRYTIRIQYEHTGGQADFQLLMDGGEHLDPNAAQIFHFSGADGQRLFFDSLNPSSAGTWILYGPNNDYIVGASLSSDMETTLNRSGDYYLILMNTPTGLSSFGFRVGTPEILPMTINFGPIARARINEPGEEHHYRFQGAAGQRIFYDSLQGDFEYMLVRLISPRGVGLNINSNSDYDYGPITLVEDGEYTLVLDGGGDLVGEYAFRMLSVLHQETLNFNTVISGNLEPFEAHILVFDESARRRLYLQSLDSNASGSWYVVSPFNGYVGGTSLNGDFEFTTTDSGTHALILSNNSNQPTPYSFRALKPVTTTATLNLGAVTTAQVPQPGDQKLFTFAGRAGQRVYYDALTLSFRPINVRLLTPLGNVLWDVWHSSDLGPVTLIEEGEYTLLVDGSGNTSGDFDFRLLDVSAAPATAIEARITDRLNTRSSSAIYQFDGTAGQRVTVHSIAASASEASWRVVDPYNQSLISAGISSSLNDVLLPVTGKYLLVIEGFAEGATGLDFIFRISDISDVAVQPSAFGQRQAGTIAAGETAVFEFTGPAGLPVFFDNFERDFDNIGFELRHQDGTSVFTANYYDSGPHILPKSGNYTLTVRGFDTGSTGDFDFRLLDLKAAPMLPMNQLVSGDLAAAYETAVFQLELVAGQRLYFDAWNRNPRPVGIAFVDPVGRLLFGSNVANDAGPITSFESGPFFAILENGSDNPTDFRFRLLDVNQSPAQPLALNTIVGSVSTGFVPLPAEALDVTGSYINTSLRNRPEPDDWRSTQSIAGTRKDPAINFIQNDWGVRSEVGLTSGEDANWEDFSVQWDGTITVTVSNSRLYVYSDDSSRFWVDLNGDGNFEVTGPEFVNNNWGTAQSTTLSHASPVLAPGTYNIRVQYEEGSGINEMFLGSESGANSIDPTEAVLFRFHAEAGQRLMFDNINPAAIRGAWRLYGPNNDYLAGTGFPGDFEYVATRTGQHLLVLSADGAPAVFYGFRAGTPATVLHTLEPGQIYTGQLSEAGENHEYAFSGSAGQMVYFDALDADFDPITASIMAPNGTTLYGNNADYDIGPIILPETGTFKVVIDGNGDAVGNFKFRLLDIAQQPEVAFDELITGTLEPGNQATLFKVDGRTGLSLLFDGPSSNSRGSWTFFAPTTQYLGGTTLGSDMEITPQIDGHHILVLSSTVNDPIPYAFRIIPGNHAPVIAPVANQTVNEGVLLSFVIGITDQESPNDTLSSLIDGLPPGAAFDPATGLFQWAPTEGQGPGVFPITLRITDDGIPARSDVKQFTIEVLEVNSAPTLASLNDRVVNPGERIEFTAAVADTDLPQNTLNFNLVSAPAGAEISPASGQFRWRPGVAQAGQTFEISVRVTDNGVPALSDTKVFNVQVNALPETRIAPEGFADGVVTIRVHGIVGPDYTLQVSTDLVHWSDVETVTPTTASFLLKDANANTPHRFYRVILNP